MNVQAITIHTSTKSHRLADASIELADAVGDTLLISDIRILENKQGQKWVAMPTRSVSDGGRAYQYIPQIDSNRQLKRKIEDAVLTAFEEWVQSQSTAGVQA